MAQIIDEETYKDEATEVLNADNVLGHIRYWVPKFAPIIAGGKSTIGQEIDRLLKTGITRIEIDTERLNVKMFAD